MSDIIPGTSGLVVVRVGTPRVRPTLNLPSLIVAQDQQPNHVLIVTSTAKSAGRNAYVNLAGSTLRAMGRDFAIVELATALGSASRAHKAESVPVELVSPLLRSDWPVELADQIDAQFGRTVIVSVQADMWLPFAKIEPALLRTFGNARPVAYAFVDPSGAATWLQGHLKWLAQRGLPAFEHRLVLRGVPLYPPQPQPIPAYHHHTTVPHFEPQVARAVFERAKATGQPQHYATFHAAWSSATSGTKSMMFDAVALAMRDIARLLEAATYNLERENT